MTRRVPAGRITQRASGSASCRGRFTVALMNESFVWLCKTRCHFPPDADIWHLRFHWQRERARILVALNAGTYRFSAMRLVTTAGGEKRAVWDAADALVLRCMTRLLEQLLPVSVLCEHVRGHGGGRASVRQTHARTLSRRWPWICRTDIRGYYGHICGTTLYAQLSEYVRSPLLLNLLHQFLNYSVEEGGVFHTPSQGIPRSSALSPLLAAFHLTETDRDFEGHRHVIYVRYMDDFLIFAPTRWHLRKAVSRLNRHLSSYGFEQHPDKTFIGRVEKGFDWMGFWFTDKGCTSVAPRAVSNCLTKLRRLYEQARRHPSAGGDARVAEYLSHWTRWARSGFTGPVGGLLPVQYADDPAGGPVGPARLGHGGAGGCAPLDVNHRDRVV